MKPPPERTRSEPVTRPRSEAAQVYDRLSAVYDVIASSERRFVTRAEELLELQAGSRVLEIGCGTGASLVELARKTSPGGAVIGVDISPKMCARSERRAERSGLRSCIEIHRTDAAALPFDEASFDAVLLSFTLELFSESDMATVLSECRRVLLEGGRLAVVSLSLTNAGPAVRLYEWFHRRFPRMVDCRPIAPQRVITDAGYSILTAESYRLWRLPVDIVLATPSPCR